MQEQTATIEAYQPLSKEELESSVEGYSRVLNFYSNFTQELEEEHYICEIGCGRGSLLAACKRRGHKVIGCEPSKALAAQAMQAYNLLDSELKDCDSISLLQVIKERSIKVKMVFLWHVLEHLNNPIKILNLFSEIMVSRGLIICQVPLLKQEYLFPEQLIFYTEPSISYLAHQIGCEVVQINYDHELMFLSFVLRKVD